MILYVSIMLLFLVMALTKQNKMNRRSIAFFCTVILTLLMGLRATNIGNDTKNYVYFFERISQLSGWIDQTSRFEIGYQIYSKLIANIFVDYQYLFIISAIISMFCVAKYICKYSVNISYSFFLFVGLRFFYFFLSGLRQSIAVSIVLIAFVFLKEKKNIKYILLVILASMFHTSAIVFLLAWPVSRMKLCKKGIVIIIIVIVGTYILFNPLLSLVLRFLPEYYSHYIKTAGFDVGNLANYLAFLLKISFIALAYFTNYGRIKNNDLCDNNLMIANDNISIQHTGIYFMIIAAGLALLATRGSMLDRLEQYYWIFAIVSIPDIIKNVKNRNNKLIVYVGVTLLVLMYNLLLLWLKPEWNMVVPYKFFWR